MIPGRQSVVERFGRLDVPGAGAGITGLPSRQQPILLPRR
jgi:hypothetical protein